MTIRRSYPVSHAAGPLLLALLAGCDAQLPGTDVDLSQRGAPAALAVDGNCKPLPIAASPHSGNIVPAAYPSGTREVWNSELATGSQVPRMAARFPEGPRSRYDGSPGQPPQFMAPQVSLPAASAPSRQAAPAASLPIQNYQAPPPGAARQLAPLAAFPLQPPRPALESGPSLSLPDETPSAPPAETLAPQSSIDSQPLFEVAADPIPAEIEAAAAQTQTTLRQGVRLAERRACFSAKAEFTKALWIVAQALDGPTQSRHTSALSAALRALEEVDDFVPRSGRPDGELQLALIISGHHTKVLAEQPTQNITARMAIDRYLVFAQQKFTEAMDGQRLGSQALYLLGRLHWSVATDRVPCFVAAEAKGLAFQQAAVSIDPDNVLAANELGVMLARSGRYEEAKSILQHCASLAPRPEIWHNLVVVHRQLGEVGFAERAQTQLLAMQGGQPTTAPIGKPQPANMIRWVQPEEFARSAPVSEISAPPSAAIPAPRTEVAPAAAAIREPAGPFGWFSRTGQPK